MLSTSTFKAYSRANFSSIELDRSSGKADGCNPSKARSIRARSSCSRAHRRAPGLLSRVRVGSTPAGCADALVVQRIGHVATNHGMGVRFSPSACDVALVVQRTGHRFPKPGTKVRFLPRACAAQAEMPARAHNPCQSGAVPGAATNAAILDGRGPVSYAGRASSILAAAIASARPSSKGRRDAALRDDAMTTERLD